MDAVRGTPGFFYIMHQCFIHIQQVRAFEEEFGFYQLQLQVHLSRCATISRSIHGRASADNSLAINPIEGPENTSDDQEPTIAEIVSAIQIRLRKAQQEAAKMEADVLASRFEASITTTLDLRTMRVRMTRFLNKQKVQAAKTIEGMKWAFYKKDKHDKFVTDISALIEHLERKVSRESLTLGDAIMYIARAHS
ncbi:hypothetical protein V8C42DRAFT_325739 [Trichoderma barbatum]